MREMLRRARLADQRRSVERPTFPDVVPGLYVQHREGGFVAHITASESTFSTIRGLTVSVPMAYGAGQDTAGSAQWVVSELLGNAKRACGDHVPLVIEVYVTGRGIQVNVHDPAADLLPRRTAVAMDSDNAESGRGLGLLDLLAPGWDVAPSRVGKQVRCHLLAAE
ncbi:ATP-binding protein [Streptomyces sp. HNM0663]|uniref:ATP-binding protein n=1 Tax=Streptomyces chengmaiensis TaxID=3040919 RepID=A0ABT6HWA9_9ACTN|nr:ATP-binding protein [Streptomyces chengmaiensis]MDH2392993.1 ATP-binding protein [Streptomyces chengmaiensis]